MAHLRNGLFYSNTSLAKPIAEINSKVETVSEFPLHKMIDNIQPLLDYCEYSDINDTRTQLFKTDEVKSNVPNKFARAESKLIDSKPTPEPSNYFLKVASSYIGVHVHQPEARQALKNIIIAHDLIKKSTDKEDYYIIKTLLTLATIYNELPARSMISPAKALSFIGLATKEPLVRAAIKTIFIAYNVMPKEDTVIDKNQLEDAFTKIKLASEMKKKQ